MTLTELKSRADDLRIRLEEIHKNQPVLSNGDKPYYWEWAAQSLAIDSTLALCERLEAATLLNKRRYSSSLLGGPG